MVADICLNDGKLVAAEPRDEVGLPDAALQTRRNGLQQVIADMVPE